MGGEHGASQPGDAHEHEDEAFVTLEAGTAGRDLRVLVKTWCEALEGPAWPSRSPRTWRSPFQGQCRLLLDQAVKVKGFVPTMALAKAILEGEVVIEERARQSPA